MSAVQSKGLHSRDLRTVCPLHPSWRDDSINCRRAHATMGVDVNTGTRKLLMQGDPYLTLNLRSRKNESTTQRTNPWPTRNVVIQYNSLYFKDIAYALILVGMPRRVVPQVKVLVGRKQYLVCISLFAFLIVCLLRPSILFPSLSDPASHAASSSPPSHNGSYLRFYGEKPSAIQPFLPSSTHIEFRRLPTLRALGVNSQYTFNF